MNEMLEVAVFSVVLGMGLSILAYVFVVNAVPRAGSEHMAVVMAIFTVCLLGVLGIQMQQKAQLRAELTRLHEMAVDAGLGEFVDQIVETKKVFVIKKAEEAEE